MNVVVAPYALFIPFPLVDLREDGTFAAAVAAQGEGRHAFGT